MSAQPQPSKIEAAELPDTVLTECPMRSRLVRIGDTCFRCEHFHALGMTNPDERIPWNQRHNVLCKFPRRLIVHHLEPEPADHG